MRAISWINYGALAGALALSTAAAVWRLPHRGLPVRGEELGATATSAEEGAGRGHLTHLVDHSGTPVPLLNYRRIVSGSTLADALLVELCEPDRIVAFTGYSARNSVRGYRYAGKAVIESLGDIEGLLALRPDLVLVNDYGDPRRIARLREAGLAVHDLGSMRGMATLLHNVGEVAALVGHAERGERLATSLAQQMASVAADIPASRRRRGLYASSYGGRLYGGAMGTSFHDVLGAGGLIDAASPQYRDWPEYTSEQILALDPDVIVTKTGMRRILCSQTGFDHLRACGAADGVVEIDDAILDDSGLMMLDAARAVRAAVHGPIPPLDAPPAR